MRLIVFPILAQAGLRGVGLQTVEVDTRGDFRAVMGGPVCSQTGYIIKVGSDGWLGLQMGGPVCSQTGFIIKPTTIRGNLFPPDPIVASDKTQRLTTSIPADQ